MISSEEAVNRLHRRKTAGVPGVRLRQRQLALQGAFEKAASAIWQNEAKKLNCFRADRQPLEEKLKIPIACPALLARYHDRSLLRYAASSWGSTRRRRGRRRCRTRDRKIFPCLTESLACSKCAPIATRRHSLNRARLHCTLYVAPRHL
jgi:hypothetical protein